MCNKQKFITTLKNKSLVPASSQMNTVLNLQTISSRSSSIFSFYLSLFLPSFRFFRIPLLNPLYMSTLIPFMLPAPPISFSFYLFTCIFRGAQIMKGLHMQLHLDYCFFFMSFKFSPHCPVLRWKK